MARNSARVDGLADVLLVAIRSCAVNMTIALFERSKDDVLDARVASVSLKGTETNCRNFVAVVKTEGGWERGERWHGCLMAVMWGEVNWEGGPVGRLEL
jgi:hypothetical protein